MYLLDTNVVSEIRKIKSAKANKNVTQWANNVSVASLFISSITILEIEIGILLIERKDPKQGAILRAWYEQQVLPTFVDRTLAVDTAVVRLCAKLHVPNRRPDRDTFIAATAMVHSFTVVTRNVDDFAIPGVKILNPWL